MKINLEAYTNALYAYAKKQITKGRKRKERMQILDEIYTTIDSIIQDNAPETQCKIGCNFCCHLRVDVTALEAERIVEYLKTLPYKEHQTLRQHIKTTAEQTAKLDINERIKAKIPCPLLSPDGKCRVYPVRPLSCRGFSSIDASQCKQNFGNPEGRTPLEAFTAFTCGGAILGLKAGLDSDLQDLNHRLSKLMHN